MTLGSSLQILLTTDQLISLQRVIAQPLDPISNEGKCSSCGSLKFWTIIVNNQSSIELCIKCGVDLETMIGWTPDYRNILAYLVCTMGIVRLTYASLLQPSVFLDNYIVTPYDIQKQRCLLAKSLGSAPLPTCLSVVREQFDGKVRYRVVEDSYFPLENDSISDPRLRLLLPRVNLPTLVIHFNEMWYRTDKSSLVLRPFMLHPRIVSVVSDYPAISDRVRYAMGKWGLPLDEETYKQITPQKYHKPSNQLFTAPFSLMNTRVHWTWELQQTLLIVKTSTGHSMLVSKKFVNTMTFIDPDGSKGDRWYVVRNADKMTSVYANDPKKRSNRASLTTGSALDYKGGVDCMLECMLGLIILIRDSLTQLNVNDLHGFEVLKDDAEYVGGVRKALVIDEDPKV